MMTKNIASKNNLALDVSSLIVTTSAFVKKKRSKMRHLKNSVKLMEVKLRSKIDLRRFHELSLDVSYLIVTTSAFVKKKRSKM